MCEILYLAAEPKSLRQERTDEDKRWNAGLFRAGDVIAVKPDGWRWGTEELKAPFGVARLPGVPVEKMEHLLAGDPDDGSGTLFLRQRTYKINAAALKADMTETDFKRDVQEVKSEPARDSSAIGPEPGVIG